MNDQTDKLPRAVRETGAHPTQDDSPPADLVYPTRFVPAERLDKLTGLVEIGGDALADSEALYEPSRHSMLSLQGLGKKIWLDVDAQEYIDQERASWDAQPGDLA